MRSKSENGAGIENQYRVGVRIKSKGKIEIDMTCRKDEGILGFKDGLDSQLDLIDGAGVGMSNGWTDWDEIFYVYSNRSLDDFKTLLDLVGGAAVGISLKAFRAERCLSRQLV
ncbi:hypothetical protein EVAR_98892_1 [Eumeta japonica]|uniref:Uncharacterized protein n=1 Tax=Eumeta variegata TaxID=151549 RepID=A0A4C1Y1E3_EUMVA|nr:hypothetical protein EVAR_98892_1 [Eumeta japonica]